MTDVPPDDLAALERRYGIPTDTYCGLSPEEMSRAIVAIHGGPRRRGEPAGFWPTVSVESMLAALREEFGPEADVERIRLQEQFFGGRVSRALAVDWMLPADAFGRAVTEGLARHFPELGDDARRVIAGSYAYSHAK